jgi:DNA-binding CsgD family transcriptional regulator
MNYGIAKSDTFLHQIEEAQHRDMRSEIRQQVITSLRMSLVPTLSSIRSKATQARELFEQGDTIEPLVLLSEIKLLSSDALEFTLSEDTPSLRSTLFGSGTAHPQPQCFERNRVSENRTSPPLNDTFDEDRSARQVQNTLLFTRREADIVPLLIEGKSNAEIASALNLSELTVKSYISNLLSKTQTENRTQLAVYLVKQG